MKLPSVPWKKNAAIGGVVRIRSVNNTPIPPVCIAWLVMPFVKSVSNNTPSPLTAQSDPATFTTIFMQIDTITSNLAPTPIDIGLSSH
ncbi:hypothetical protein JH274_07955 [Xanthomonas campestris pv. incanae]|uniref:hypothetical protein n=1 Tax=Xanthomonas campestris TaxID=339 RepID=UPI00236787B7|nr:hypothetical protein [Xanthomonas campestris]WDK27188.1 hypothetical protein JH274_07955 [Xanthomonas campestris pv. incanae]